MPIEVQCPNCPQLYDVPDHLIGKRIRCKACGADMLVEDAPIELELAEDRFTGKHTWERDPDSPKPEPFAHERYTFAPAGIGINGCYEIGDPYAETILYARAPYRITIMGWIMLVFLGPSVSMCCCGTTIVQVGQFFGNIGQGLPPGMGTAIFLVSFLCLSFFGMIGGRGRLTVNEDAGGKFELLEVKSSTNLLTLTKVFTLKRGDGKILARFRRNMIVSFLINRVTIHDARGKKIAIAYEHAFITPIIRRFGLPFLDVPFLKLATRWMLRTNFRIHAVDGARLGEVNRKDRIEGRNVLDLTDDEEQTLDRRIAIPLALVLDLYPR